MIKNKVIIFFVGIFVIFTILIGYLTFDSKLRRQSYNYLVGGYQLYQYFKMGKHVINRDFNSASKDILQYIEFSQKISKGKNNMLQGIVSVTELITSKALTQKNFNEMENVYLKINEISDDIYINHVWLARALSDDNPNKAIKHLNKALRLSKSSEEAYREIIRLYSKDKEIISLINTYCKNYFNDFGGGVTKRTGVFYDNKNFFYGSSANFAISRNSISSQLNSRFIHSMNEYQSYDFIFEEVVNLNQFNIFKNFFPGAEISIKNIVLHNDKKNIVNLKDIQIYSLSSYILDQSNEEIVFLNTNDESDILKFNLDNVYDDINQITLDLKLKRLPLTNKLECENIDEN
jgi:hypothetical protein